MLLYTFSLARFLIEKMTSLKLDSHQKYLTDILIINRIFSTLNPIRYFKLYVNSAILSSDKISNEHVFKYLMN